MNTRTILIFFFINIMPVYLVGAQAPAPTNDPCQQAFSKKNSHGVCPACQAPVAYRDNEPQNHACLKIIHGCSLCLEYIAHDHSCKCSDKQPTSAPACLSDGIQLPHVKAIALLRVRIPGNRPLPTHLEKKLNPHSFTTHSQFLHSIKSSSTLCNALPADSPATAATPPYTCFFTPPPTSPTDTPITIKTPSTPLGYYDDK